VSTASGENITLVFLRVRRRSRILKIGLRVPAGVVAVIGLERGFHHRPAVVFLYLVMPAIPVLALPVGVSSAQEAPMCKAPSDERAAVDLASRTFALPRELACMPPPGFGLGPLASRTAPAGRGGDDENDRAHARRALEALERHRVEGRVPDALLSLATLRELVPELADRWDLIEGELRSGERRGCDAYTRALQSPVSAVAARARVGRTRCLLEVDDRRASDELRALLARYPELPEALSLQLLEGEHRERRGEFAEAIALYRHIDLLHPGTREAARARERLAALEVAGHRVRPLSSLQLVERAERLVRSGPPDLAREEVGRLRETRLPVPLQAAVALLAARLARIEGRFEDADRLMREARRLSPTVGDDSQAVAAQAEDLAVASASRSADEAHASLRRLVRSPRALATAATPRVFSYLRVAARAGLRDETNLALDALHARPLPCGLRLEAALVASAVGDDAKVAVLLERCVAAPGSLGVSSRYHRARALERLGRVDDARREFERVLELDRSETRWYAFWSRQRLAVLGLDAIASGHDAVGVTETESSGPAIAADARPAAPAPEPALDGTVGPMFETSRELTARALAEPALPWTDPRPGDEDPGLPWTDLGVRDEDPALHGGKSGERGDELGLRRRVAVPSSGFIGPAWGDAPREADPDAEREPGFEREPTPGFERESELGCEPEPEPDSDPAHEAVNPLRPRWQPTPRPEIERRLSALAQTWGEPFPWFARALAALRLGRDDIATEELHEAYLAWHEARGRGPLRAGVEAVYRGATPPRRRVPGATIWRARRTLSIEARRDLGVIAASLGDFGLAVRWGGPWYASLRPRPYAEIVEQFARERGLDPNLVFAVMRVESVYNPRIVSSAGAIGLLQIMPRTGRLIARNIDREDFGIDDLLDPRSNIEMGTWYLASLIRRFEGCVLLAVAAYNGGPHNVRRWLREYATSMPLDAFLERIPFHQTHRYVRRVLSHWAAYRAQQGLSPPVIDLAIPDLGPDRVAF
jgi:soluble lytic murein transglycosylase